MAGQGLWTSNDSMHSNSRIDRRQSKMGVKCPRPRRTQAQLFFFRMLCVLRNKVTFDPHLLCLILVCKPL
jgi:hypothetical protein